MPYSLADSPRVTFRMFHVEQSFRKERILSVSPGGMRKCSTWNNPDFHLPIIVPRETTCIPRWSLLDFRSRGNVWRGSLQSLTKKVGWERPPQQ